MTDNPVVTDLIEQARKTAAKTGALQSAMKAVAAELAPPRPEPAGGSGAA